MEECRSCRWWWDDAVGKVCHCEDSTECGTETKGWNWCPWWGEKDDEELRERTRKYGQY